jgi:hypothetical protein
MVLGMPLGAFLTDRFSQHKQYIIVPAGLLSCAAFAGAACANSWTVLYTCLLAQGEHVLVSAALLCSMRLRFFFLGDDALTFHLNAVLALP